MAYMRDKNSRRLDDLDVLAKPDTRLADYMVTAPNTSTSGALDLTQRTIFKPNVTPARWRIGFRNYNLRASTYYTTPCTITGVWAGTPAYDTSTSGPTRWNGHATAAPTQVHTGSITVPVDGTFAWSNWVNGDATYKTTGKLISWGFTSTATGTGIATGNGFQGCSASGASNAGNQTLTSPSIAANAVHLDVVIEYEFADTAKVIVFVGDSNTVGYSPAGPPLITSPQASVLPHESWPMLAAAQAGFVAVNLGVGSATVTEFASTRPQMWSRLSSTVDLDAAVVSLGTNELTSGDSNFITQCLAVNTLLRGTYGVTRIYWTTITPRCYPDGAYTSGGTKVAGTLSADAASGATSVSCSFSPALAAMLIGTGPNAESRTVTGVSGSGPYTATVAALTNTHYAGEALGQGDELYRRKINNYLRQNPDGITGCFDFEKVMESSPGAFRMDDRYSASDWLHRQRGAQAALAALVAAVGVAANYA